jgi:hypothetical protein
MHDKVKEAYSAVHSAAWDIARGVVESITAAIKAGEVADEGGVSDMLHDECDNACIYTADCYALVWGLPEASEDAVADFGAGTFSDAITKQAYANLHEYVQGAEDWDALLDESGEDKRDTDESED